jgi:hypothetical protein
VSFRPVSLLEKKAKELNVNLRNASANVLLRLYRETLIDIESFLDTGDLNLLTESSITTLRDDVLSIIRGLRSIREISKEIGGQGRFAGFDAVLNDLRLVRNSLQVALGLHSRPNLSAKFYNELSGSRKILKNAISRLSGDVTTDAPPPPKKK